MSRVIAGAAVAVLVVAGCSSGGSTPSAAVPSVGLPSAPIPSGAAPSLAIPSLAIPSLAIPSIGGGNGSGTAMPCDKLAPIVTQITGLSIAEFEAQDDDCSFTVNTSGDSSSAGFGGIVDIRRESATTDDFDLIATTFTGTDGIDVQGVGDRARRTAHGNLMYAIHAGQIWAVQLELLTANTDPAGTATKLMQALFRLV